MKELNPSNDLRVTDPVIRIQRDRIDNVTEQKHFNSEKNDLFTIAIEKAIA